MRQETGNKTPAATSNRQSSIDTLQFVCDLVSCRDGSGEGSALKRIRICPDGEVASTKGDFIFDAESWRLIKKQFDAQAVAKVIDKEHQTLGGEYASPDGDARAYGWMETLEYVPGEGIFASVNWTQRGTELIRADEYRYLSPVIIVRKSDRKAVGLHSAGLTNTPAIPGMDRLAAKQMANDKESTMAEQPAEGVGQDPSMLVGELKSLLEITIEETDVVSVLKAVIEKVKALKGKGGEEKEDGEGGGDAVASSVRKALNLSADADADTVVVAINTLRAGTKNVETLRGELDALKVKDAKRDRDAFLQPYKNSGVLDEKDDAPFFQVICRTYAANPDDAKVLLEARAALLPASGRTTPPGDGPKPGGGDNEDKLIAKALTDHDGNTKAAYIALQGELIDKEVERTGHARGMAAQNLAPRFPKIFG